MKKELSFYEFVGILIPGVTALFGVNMIYNLATSKQLINFDKIGETIVFLIISYAAGHLVQSIGNIFETIVWKIYGGMPTAWLSKQNNFKKKLFDDPLNQNIADKVAQKFGVGNKDCGLLVYNVIFLSGKSSRIDIFNGNYSLFRGLSVTFLLLAILCSFYFSWWQALLSFIPFILLTRRMIRFAKHYAKETYRTFYNLP